MEETNTQEQTIQQDTQVVDTPQPQQSNTEPPVENENIDNPPAEGEPPKEGGDESATTQQEPTVTELQKTVTENKQDADSFKQTVEETYATKDSLNDYATTSQVSSAIEQKANIILGTVTDSEGNTTTYQGTLAGLASPIGFQDRPLQPLGYFSIFGGPCRTRTYNYPFMRRGL